MTTINLREEQLKIESGAVQQGVTRYNNLRTSRQLSDLAPGQVVIKNTLERMTLVIKAYIEDISSGSANRGAAKLKFMKLLPPATLAHLVLTTLLNDAPEKLGTLANRVGRRIEDELNALALKNGKDADGNPLRVLFMYITEKLASDGSRHFKRKALEFQKNKHSIKSIAEELGWDDEAKATMGMTLIYLVLENTDMFAKLLENQGQLEKNSFKTVHMIYPTSSLTNFINNSHEACALMRPVIPAMVVPPVDWNLSLFTDEDGVVSVKTKGGFITPRLKLDFIKGANPNYLMEAIETGKLDNVLKSMNYLQKTAWRINPDVLRVVAEIYDNDLEIALPKITPINPDGKPAGYSEAHARFTPMFKAWAKEHRKELRGKGLTRGQKYDMFLQMYPEYAGDLALVRGWKRHAAEIHALNSSSERITELKDLAMKVTMAKEYAHYPAVYFPHQLDFRGRAYPATNFLNPQGDALCKALLDFSEGLPLDEEAAEALAIHGANCWANNKLDKAKVEVRIQWVKDNTDNILRAAKDPLGYQWWKKAGFDGDFTKEAAYGDNAFLFLAFCFEWARWIEGGVGTLCHLPVSFDGSCNGIQHYAALLRDEADGFEVNLVPSEQPQDIYARVGAATPAVIARHVGDEKKSKYAQVFLPMFQNLSKARSLVKTPTMTTSYAVTAFGIRDQLRKKHKELWAIPKDATHSALGFNKEENKEARSYLAEAIMEGIRETIKSATYGMDFLKGVASAAADQGLPLNWTTPDGFQVQQKYEKFDQVVVKTVFAGSVRVKAKAEGTKLSDVCGPLPEAVDMGGVEVEPAKRTVSVTLAKANGVLNARKQASAVGPNFIHSLDAAHLRMTLVRCADEGIPAFAAVHDSYGVHACHAKRLGQLLREEFVNAHSTNLLEAFRNEIASMPGINEKKLPAVPPRGNLDIELVKQSVYFFL